MNMVVVASSDSLSPWQRPKLAIFLQRILWKSCLKSHFIHFFHSNLCKNVVSLAIFTDILFFSDTLSNHLTSNIFITSVWEIVLQGCTVKQLVQQITVVQLIFHVNQLTTIEEKTNNVHIYPILFVFCKTRPKYT